MRKMVEDLDDRQDDFLRQAQDKMVRLTLNQNMKMKKAFFMFCAAPDASFRAKKGWPKH